jgi:hypothetical protein
MRSPQGGLSVGTDRRKVVMKTIARFGTAFAVSRRSLDATHGRRRSCVSLCQGNGVVGTQDGFGWHAVPRLLTKGGTGVSREKRPGAGLKGPAIERDGGAYEVGAVG